MTALQNGDLLTHFADIDSTNSAAKRSADAGDLQRRWFLADTQSAGRGRRGRHWVSPRGNLMASLLVPGPMSLARAGQYAFVTGLALADAVAHFVDIPDRVALKWPNDVLLDGGKICGLLLEGTQARGDALEGLVIGCGMNIVAAPQDTPYPASYLGAHCDEVPSPRAVLERLARGIETYERILIEQGFEALLARWTARAAGYGGQIIIRLETEELSGRWAGIDGRGALLLDLPDGSRRIISAGDLYFPHMVKHDKN